MKPLAVLDSSVVVSAIGWRDEARNVFRLLARRSFISVRSAHLTQEWTETLAELAAAPQWRNANWVNWLQWLTAKSRFADDPPIKSIVRDPKDDPILALAISEKAQYVVSMNRDLLDLEKPYGVRCVRLSAFLTAILISLHD